MKPKENRKALTADDIQVNKTYRGKNPAAAGYDRALNDRTVLYISRSRTEVQYDSSAVGDGKEYPTVPMEKFLKWASHEVV